MKANRQGSFLNTESKLGRIIIAVLLGLFAALIMAFGSSAADFSHIDGISQGSDNIYYANAAPIADIFIDPDMLDFNKNANNDNVVFELLDPVAYPGFVFLTAEEIDAKYPDSGRSSELLNKATSYPADTKYLVYDESQQGALKITGNTNNMNTFSGDIARFTFRGAAVLPGSASGNVVITYSNISFPMQNNFGKHLDAGSYTAKYQGKYERFYKNPASYMRTAGPLKDGKTLSDFWRYDPVNDRGEYIGNGLYTVGVGPYIHTTNNLVEDRINANGDYGFTTRNGLKLDIKVQVTDDEGKVIEDITGIMGRTVKARFFYSMRDIDVDRSDNINFSQLYDYQNQNYYSESIRLDYGVDIESDIYIPGPESEYKYTEILQDQYGTVFRARVIDSKNGEQDPGTTYSGFTTVIDNAQGLGITYWSSGSASAKVRTWIFEGHTFYKLKSSTGTGGTIKTTSSGNNTENGDLSEGAVFGSTTIEVTGGKTVKYRIAPRNPGYWLNAVIVDGLEVSIPSEEGEESTITLGSGALLRQGVLKNLGNGEFVFTFPDNVADHEIHVDWDSDHFFEKKWVDEEGSYIDITLKAYEFDGGSLPESEAVAPRSFRVHKNDSNVTRTENSDGTVSWLIKKTDLPIEPEPDDHDGDHHCPLYWFAEEAPLTYFDTGYSNSEAEAMPYYENNEKLPDQSAYDGSRLAILNSLIRAKEDCAFLNQKDSDYGVITNSLKHVDVVVNKTIVGNARSGNDEFVFTADFKSLYPDRSFDYVITSGDTEILHQSFSTDSSGNASVTFMLKGGETWTAGGITPTGTVSISEASSDYKAEYELYQDGRRMDSFSNNDTNRDIATDEVSTYRNIRAEFTNTRYVTVPTGKKSDSRPWTSMLMVILVLLIAGELLVIIRLKRSRHYFPDDL